MYNILVDLSHENRITYVDTIITRRPACRVARGRLIEKTEVAWSGGGADGGGGGGCDGGGGGGGDCDSGGGGTSGGGADGSGSSSSSSGADGGSGVQLA